MLFLIVLYYIDLKRLKIPRPYGHAGSIPASGTRLRSRITGENEACHGVARGEAGPPNLACTRSKTLSGQASLSATQVRTRLTGWKSRTRFHTC